MQTARRTQMVGPVCHESEGQPWWFRHGGPLVEPLMGVALGLQGLLAHGLNTTAGNNEVLSRRCCRETVDRSRRRLKSRRSVWLLPYGPLHSW